MDLTHPLPGYEITTPFGGYPGHRGADFAAPSGVPILASHDGRVRFAGWDDRGGYMIYLTAVDGTFETSYQHMQSRPFAHDGQHITAGQSVGHVGTTGYSTGPHLHFELWVNGIAHRGGIATDPAPYLREHPAPQPNEEETDEEDEPMSNIFIAKQAGSKQINAIINTVSGFVHEFESSDGGYNTNIARTFGVTTPSSLITESQYDKIIADCQKIR